ncbi:hypothetical protein ZEAMMB73_Zm00001d032970 [Zea mays]|uniref:Uncharacterized protein n=1 Tax=Zea mays TaxID=4577 RepID=A0A1D6KVA1_MAIZE|nr:hypothetical protein ZEAMMB73_Zm00001d032970 [Zea mays]
MEVPMNSTQSGPHFPVQHQSLSLDIKGNKTDIVISKYEDTFLVRRKSDCGTNRLHGNHTSCQVRLFLSRQIRSPKHATIFPFTLKLCILYFFIKSLTPLDRKDESVFSDPTYNVSVLFGKRNEWQWLSSVIGYFSGSERSFSGNTEGYHCSCDRESPLVMIE